ncbi:SAV_6107 family HEPN domain-containing protein [Frankia sp. AvcI1]|uniref:SAV_6107 family HEPN domain-containing protein n=1 Tax=Frankia sp. AvcI1 TaxID=573496 RepID=UPI00191015D4|nr:SAV_6107 family HEPN domain-containing protein [Frankia sp. AvcI1]
MAVVSRPVSGAGPAGGAVGVEGTSAGRGASSGPPGRALLPAAGLPHRSRDELLAAARRGLGEAEYAPRAGERYALAHLAALRAAAAVLADRARPRPGRRGRPVSAWCLLVRVAPELVEWADFFAAGAGRRAAAEAGLNVVGRREADDLIRQVDQFIGVVEGALGLPSQPVLAGTGPADVAAAAAVPPRRG